MNMNPIVTGMLASERQRDMLAEASRLRMVREARAGSAAARRTKSAQPRTGRLFRRARPAVSPS